jgi:hypothetical protein
MFELFPFDFQPLLCISKMWRWFIMFHNSKTITYMGSHQCMWWSTWSLWGLMIPSFLQEKTTRASVPLEDICNLITKKLWMVCNCPWLICPNLSCHKFAIEFQLTTLDKTSFITFENCHLFFKQEWQHTTTLKYLLC